MAGRRQFLKLAATAVAGTALGRAEGEAVVGGLLPAWEPGVLEIHQIDTGRGNAAFLLYPDGTTLLLDAGEAHSAAATMPAALPDGSRRAGEWIARYVARQLARAGRTELDHVLVTHLHGDHVGEVTSASPASVRGGYRLTGLADVAEQIPVRHLVDRGWPQYAYPAPLKDPASLNYVALARSLAGLGTRVEMAVAGSVGQVGARRDVPGFDARILSVNGQVAGASGERPVEHFPPLEGRPVPTLPTENMCCVSLRVQYGAFRFFSGGDLTCDTDFGVYPWRNIETPVARAAGPVSVAVADHHGYFDATGPEAVRALQPRVWILPEWHVSHPALGVLNNLFSTELYPGERSVFALGMTPEAVLTTERFSGRLRSTRGHVVIRVPQRGRDFTVSVVDARNESGTVTARFGPFAS